MLFSQIIGHEDIKKKLIQSVKENRVAHAQLFLGPEGTGKLALAIAYAQYINCTNKKENDSCGECPSCKKFNSFAHPDLHFIFPTTTNKSVKKDPESDLFMTEWRDYLVSNKAYADQKAAEEAKKKAEEERKKQLTLQKKDDLQDILDQLAVWFNTYYDVDETVWDEIDADAVLELINSVQEYIKAMSDLTAVFGKKPAAKPVKKIIKTQSADDTLNAFLNKMGW